MITSLFARFIQNRHTSAAAVIYALAAFGLPIIATWWPDYTAKLDSTRKTLEALAVFYGFAAAGDAGANVSGQTPVQLPKSQPIPDTATKLP